MEEDLKKRIEDLERNNRNLAVAVRDLDVLCTKKSELMRKMAHDMRSPLSAVKSYADMMLMFRDEPVEVREKFLETIIQASDKLNRLIDELQNLAREKVG